MASSDHTNQASSIPIVTLAGLTNISDVLKDLPVPGPSLPQDTRSLLFQPDILDETRRVLASRDPNLASQLVGLLCQADSSDVQVKDGLEDVPIQGDIPQILQEVLRQKADVFTAPRHPGGPTGANQLYQQNLHRPGVSQPPPQYHNNLPNDPLNSGYGDPMGYSNQLPNQQREVPPYASTAFGSHQANQAPIHPHEQANVYPQNALPGYQNTASPAQGGAGPVNHGYQHSETPNAGPLPMDQKKKSSKNGKGLAGLPNDGPHPPYGQPTSGPTGADPHSTHPSGDDNHSTHPAGVAYPEPPAAPGSANYTHQAQHINNTAPVDLAIDNIGSDEQELKRMASLGDELANDVKAYPQAQPSGSTDLGNSHSTAELSAIKSDWVPTVMLEDYLANKTAEDHNNAKKKRSVEKARKKESRSASEVSLNREPKVVLEDVLAQKHHRETGESSSTPKSGKAKQRVSNEHRHLSEESQLPLPTLRIKRLEDFPINEAVIIQDSNPTKMKICLSKLSNKRSPHSEESEASDDGMYHKKKRKNTHKDVDYEERHKKKKHKKHKSHHKRDRRKEITLDEELDTAALRRFGTVMENIIDTRGNLRMVGDDVRTESLCERLLLSDFCNEASKLKSAGAASTVPSEKVVKLFQVVLFNIQDGIKALGHIKLTQYEEVVREPVMNRVLGGLDASLGVLSMLTSPGMSQRVYVDEVITAALKLSHAQLTKIICPQFDPVYRHSSKESEGSMRQKRARAGAVKSKTVQLLYNKYCDLMDCVAELVERQPLTDEMVLKVSSLGVIPFFVENISELQLACIRLVTAVFARYDRHRQLIIEDIFSSLARLPSSKNSLRTFRIKASEHIQMFTGLILQLLQSVVRIPKPDNSDKDTNEADEIIIVTTYEAATNLGIHFLSIFLKKCATKGEEDFRPLFENFVEDLLITVNTPEWPGAELLLSLLGRLLVRQFTTRSTEMSLRVISLDHMGTVTARLRKDTMSSQVDLGDLDDILRESGDEDNGENDSSAIRNMDEAKRNRLLQKIMIEYLTVNGQSDNSLLYARNFFVAQWYREVDQHAEREVQTLRKGEEDEFEEEDEHTEERSARILHHADKHKKFLLKEVFRSSESKLKYSSLTLNEESATMVTRYLASLRPFAHSFNGYLTQILKVLSETAVAVRSKAIKCLSLIIEVDPSILAREDIMLGVHARFKDQSTLVREAAVDLVGKFVLCRPDLALQYYPMLSERILDMGVSVRKRVIKIFREICTEQPNFVKIPEMCIRMLRRVNDEEGIKKLVTETFQAMWFSPLRSGSSSSEELQQLQLQRVLNITQVVAAIKDTSYEFIEQLMKDLLKKTDGSERATKKAFRQIVDCLVQHVLLVEQKTVQASHGAQGSSQKLVACLSTLYLFSKARPKVMVHHGNTLQPYLEIKCTNPQDRQVVLHVTRILELVVPLMEHPSESFTTHIETNMVTLILQHGMVILQSCVACLGAVVNKVTNNYKLAADCFIKFYTVIQKYRAELVNNPTNPDLQSRSGILQRSLFLVGSLCRHFDFEVGALAELVPVRVKEEVHEHFIYFMGHPDRDVQHKALTAIGFYCVRYCPAMLGAEVRDVYQGLLRRKDVEVKLKTQVLKNLQDYLMEDQDKTIRAEADWKKLAASEDLKEMGDVQSGMANTIIQVYVKEILESYFHSNRLLRLTAHGLCQIVYDQGFIPVQLVPYLISMSTDCDPNIRIKADNMMQDIDRKYSGFIHNKAMMGMRMSYRLQRVLQQDLCQPIRGIRDEESPVALNGALYALTRPSRQNRRALLANLLHMFDDSSKTLLGELVYVADNLAFFPYQLQDEPLFIMHQIDITVSVSGSNLLQAFREGLRPKPRPPGAPDPDPPTPEPEPEPEPQTDLDGTEPEGVGNDNHSDEGSGGGDDQPAISKETLRRRVAALAEEEDEDFESLINRVPVDTGVLQETMLLSQGCTLLLVIKQYLKEMYNISDSKLQNYSPTDAAKVWDKPLSRKTGIKFLPKQALDTLAMGSPPDHLSEEGRKQLVKDYLDFKLLMESIDPADDDEPPLKPVVAERPVTPAGEGGEPGSDPAGAGQDPSATGAGNAATPAQPSMTYTPSHYLLKAQSEKKSKPVSASKKDRSKKQSTPVTKKKKKPRHRIDSSDDSDLDPDFMA